MLPSTRFPTHRFTKDGLTLVTGNYVSYQWFRDNQAIGSAINQSYTCIANGGYEVSVVDIMDVPQCLNWCLNNLGVKGFKTVAAAQKLEFIQTRRVTWLIFLRQIL